MAADAKGALEAIHAHLQPGGSVLIPLDTLGCYAPTEIGEFREVETESGDRLRVGAVAHEPGADGQSLTLRLRYERITRRGETATATVTLKRLLVPFVRATSHRLEPPDPHLRSGGRSLTRRSGSISRRAVDHP